MNPRSTDATPTPPTPAPHAPAPRTPQRSVPLLIVAGALIVAVVGVVLLLGVEQPPAFEPLTADPALHVPASIAWIDSDGGDPCLRVAEPDGSVREVTCGLEGRIVAWTADGILVEEWARGTDHLTAIDPVAGSSRTVPNTVAPRDLEDDVDEPAPPPVPWVDRADGRITVRLPEDPHGDHLDAPVLWEGEAPQSYDLVTAVPAPDGSVVALGDTAGRLLVVPADGSSPPRVWTEQVPRHTEYIWQGWVGSAGPA